MKYTQAVAYATYFELGEPVQQGVFIHCLSLTFHAVLAQSILDTTIMRRRQDTWDRLQAEMSSKRVKAADAMSVARKKKQAAPNEIIVQRLASEPDSKQTYRPVQPREFVDFQFESK